MMSGGGESSNKRRGTGGREFESPQLEEAPRQTERILRLWVR